MRWDVFAWAAFALLLFAAEALAPGAFMLWLGFAAAAVFLGVLLIDGIPLLAQVAAFIALSFVSIQVYRRWFSSQERRSDQPALNRRTVALVQREKKMVLLRTHAIGIGGDLCQSLRSRHLVVAQAAARRRHVIGLALRGKELDQGNASQGTQLAQIRHFEGLNEN